MIYLTIMIRLTLLILIFLTHSECHNKQTVIDGASGVQTADGANTSTSVSVGAEQLDVLLPLLAGKRVGIVVNHTAVVGKTHLADTLRARNVNLIKIFGPEHGFRGNAADGEVVNHAVDTKTGLPIISLYGKNKKPTAEQIADLDVILFDIQDVGTRFYTYISTLHYVMEACAENNKTVIVLDRPNPHGSYVDGPLLQPEFKSFVGMHPIPVVHGLTVGELAQMINGEGWLGDGKRCDVKVITMKNWKHSDRYLLPIAPSPNLPTNQAVQLYPSLCFFEGTVISVGRGTDLPFQIIGNPQLTNYKYTFTPVTIKGVAVNPLHENKLCYGINLSNAGVENKINLSYLIDMYNAYPDKQNFFYNPFDKNYINKLAGSALLKEQIISGLTEAQIRETWQKDLNVYQEKRKKYLMYP